MWSPRMKFWVFLYFSFVPPVHLNRLVYYLWKSVERLKCYRWGYFFMNVNGFSHTKRVWDFWCFSFVPPVDLNRLVYYLWKSVVRLKSSCWGYFFMEIPRVLHKNEIWNFFDVSIFFRLPRWSDRYVDSENRSNR